MRRARLERSGIGLGGIWALKGCTPSRQSSIIQLRRGVRAQHANEAHKSSRHCLLPRGPQGVISGCQTRCF
ncbi:hypothetical protein E2C01_099500 [Portunus trituberculatus]|uniref:Uncharacterized protein n=1 Tax=Portunus trituberculatus TaxID=210409 RepID=A0A5B7KAJ2_PORTR|nr:hypothetical protein [Portunus trituberculatus]